MGWDLSGESDTTLGRTSRTWESVKAAADAAVAELGRVDVLVNCAGVITAEHPGRRRSTPTTTASTYEVNVMGAVHTTKALYAALEAGPGARSSTSRPRQRSSRLPTRRPTRRRRARSPR